MIRETTTSATTASTTPGCLRGCPGHGPAAPGNDQLCQVPAGETTTTCPGEAVLVSATRYADREGTDSGVQLAWIRDGVVEEPLELTPAAARQLAAQLIHAANVAEWVDRRRLAAERAVEQLVRQILAEHGDQLADVTLAATNGHGSAA